MIYIFHFFTYFRILLPLHFATFAFMSFEAFALSSLDHCFFSLTNPRIYSYFIGCSESSLFVISSPPLRASMICIN